jgi:hypothetical protein
MYHPERAVQFSGTTSILAYHLFDTEGDAGNLRDIITAPTFK